MFDSAYRRRLEADLARWQGDGVITPQVRAAIQGTLQPQSAAVTLATVVGIVGGLLIAAAFLAFIAANWAAIPRVTRFGILLVGIIGAYGLGAVFARSDREVLADTAATVGSIVFGAAIALVGQMYHLAEDFSSGMMLWSAGALIAAVATGSRGTLAVALAAGCIWSGMRMYETSLPWHLPFAAFWLVAAALAVAWNSVAARHLVAVAAMAWWGVAQLNLSIGIGPGSASATLAAGSTLLLGGGFALMTLRVEPLRLFGLTLSTYGAFGLAIACAVTAATAEPSYRMPFGAGSWAASCGIAGVVLAFASAAMSRLPGPAFGGLAGGVTLFVAYGLAQPGSGGEPWLAYALLLSAMLCLVVSGMLDEVRPRVVAGWLGLAATIAAITWGVRGSLLRRALFLAVAGLATIGLSSGLGALVRKGQSK
jgi:hypothetical protein